MTTATVRDRAGSNYSVTNTARDRAGSSYAVGAHVRDRAGTQYLIFGGEVEDDDVGGGGRKRHRRPRHNVAQLRHEDELIMDMIRQFMDRVH